MKTITINTELELMQYLLNKYDNNLTLISSADYVLGTNYNKFIPYVSCDFQDIQEYMSDFTVDENNYTVRECSYSVIYKNKKLNYCLVNVYLDNNLILIAGYEKDIMYHLYYILIENELNMDYTNILTNNKLINNLINQRIDEIMSGNTPDTNIMLSERTATLD